jgi:hypothetical protein
MLRVKRRSLAVLKKKHQVNYLTHYLRSLAFFAKKHLTYAVYGQYAKPLPTTSRTTEWIYPFFGKIKTSRVKILPWCREVVGKGFQEVQLTIFHQPPLLFAVLTLFYFSAVAIEGSGFPCQSVLGNN